MPVISLHCLAEQQWNSTLSLQKYNFFPSKFNVESNEYVPRFYKEQEVAYKLQNPNNARKT